MSIWSMKRDKILEEFSLSLTGRFLTSKQINLRAAKNLLWTMWKLGEDMKIIEVGEGILQFKFLMESQLLWVWNNGPWCFDNHLLALWRWEKGMFVSSITFLKLPFWIQVWGLLFDLINEEAGRDIGRSIGELVEVDYKAFNSDQARFLWIRLEVPLYKPLRQGGPVISLEGETSRVAFKYKQLVGWCFSYGQISHDHKDCPSPVDAEEGGRPYGEWLKAGIRGRSVEAEGTQHHETRT